VAPGFAVKAGAGPVAGEVLGSINLRPAVLEDSGYSFRDRTVHEVVRAGLAPSND
jgi:hypothetical protein